MLVSYLQAFCFLSSTFFLPNWWQSVKGVRVYCQSHSDLLTSLTPFVGRCIQVNATMSGVYMLSFSLMVSAASSTCPPWLKFAFFSSLSSLTSIAVAVPTGWYISKYGNVGWVIRIGYSVGALGQHRS
jgi:hypothetical protein